MKFEITYTDGRDEQHKTIIHAAGYGTAVEQFVEQHPDYHDFMIHQIVGD